MSTTDTETRVFHVELDISMDYRNSHEAFVIIDALEEYAGRQRWLAEDGDNAEFLNELADTADRLRERIDAQMCDANVRPGAAPKLLQVETGHDIGLTAACEMFPQHRGAAR
ncbi:hypothetical protein [Mycolicibacterium mageritense]|uniref:Uncharacterized protein n=1 Tax=Mycolicibacterium mageritense TaxID=53462 RepID=A0AAI8TY92_MYCME|nr:hypothetical protein [Mycolicibacterium mageritense]BDY33198.1 hypothetical protein hbim_07173 [Mycolicibacterium mageritense]